MWRSRSKNYLKFHVSEVRRNLGISFGLKQNSRSADQNFIHLLVGPFFWVWFTVSLQKFFNWLSAARFGFASILCRIWANKSDTLEVISGSMASGSSSIAFGTFLFDSTHSSRKVCNLSFTMEAHPSSSSVSTDTFNISYRSAAFSISWTSMNSRHLPKEAESGDHCK